MADGRIGAGHEVALRGLAAAPPLTLCQRLGTSPRGLTEAEAEQRWDPGHPDPAEPTALRRLRTAFLSPFVLLLVGLAAVFAALGDARGWVTIAVMVAISVGLRWWLQTRSDRAVRRLRSRVTRTATVRRRCAVGQPGVWREVPVQDLVPGDVVSLAAGDVVPADLRLLHANGLRVDQSVLSGEATPVRKRAPTGQEPPNPPEPPEPRPARAFWPWRRKTDTDVVDLPSVCFAGTSVVSGTATAVVMTTGPGTYFGALAREASEARPDSSVDHGVRAVGRTLLRFMLVLVPIVLVVNGSVTGDWAQAGLFAVAVAVGLTPEMLPAIVTATLARGAVGLSRRDVIVKRLDSIQDLGGMDVLCLDKTGTLTEDRVAFAHSVDLDGQLDDSAVEYAYLIGRSLSGPPDRFDRAIQDYVTEDEALLARAMYTKVDELGFDHDRRRASVVVRDPAGDHLLITSGDPDEILARCTSYQVGTRRAELDAARLREAGDLVAAHEAHGMRVLAVASRLADPSGLGEPAEPDDLERDLTLIGFVAFVDPVKATMPDAVERLAEHGVAVKMLTGDSALVAEQVCKRAGIPVGRIVLGRDVERASDSALAEMVERTTVFAKVNPQHKARIIAALRRRGHCVGFLGDGANDTTALRTADVGICVHNATPAARDAADLVLLDTDPTMLVNGVVAGRRTLGNTMKYVKITAASNLGNVFSVLAASVFLPFLPMLPVQLLAQNLIYDAAQLALPFDRVEPGYLRRPRRWDARRLGRFMLVFGPLSSLFDLATFGVLWWVVGANTPAEQSVFQAGWFTVGLLSQVLVVLVLRGRGLTRPAYAVLAAATAAVLVGLALPRSPWASALQMTAPPLAALPWLVAIVAVYLLAAALTKRAFIRRAGQWL